jgi:N-acetyl-gamma-glutamyl-phosphate reductase
MPRARFRIAVVGATGYAGAEIVRLLASHPCAKVTTVTSSRSAGLPLREECPWLHTELVLSQFDPESIKADFIFLAQDAGFAMEHAAHLLETSRVIDLSADFRLRDPSAYEAYYRRPMRDIGVEAVYGLPELVDRDKIANARLLANPGCYPTATLLALMPLVESGLVAGLPVVDAKSGVSGAGRSRMESDYMFSELDGGFKPYVVAKHRHLPEIEQMAGVRVRFTPHLIPVARGLEATVHVPIRSEARLDDLYREAYRNEPFVTVQGWPPSTKQVLGSNRCVVAPFYDDHTGCAVICSVIDNLVKGAAGQAIQNMNLMAGIPEETGLPLHGVWP